MIWWIIGIAAFIAFVAATAQCNRPTHASAASITQRYWQAKGD